MSFEDKVVLITGAVTGIGRAAVIGFAKQGAMIGVNHYQQHNEFITLGNELSATAKEKLIELEADVSQGSAVHSMVEQFIEQTGKIDVLINNAGISMIKPFLEIKETEWDHVINTDLKSVYHCCRAVLPYMQENKNGVIINLSSELAYSGRAGFSVYTAAKGAIISLTRSLAKEFAPDIRVNAVAPGPTQTPLLEKEIRTPGHKESLDDIPLGRYASAEEIAETILFLASDKAKYYCGEVLSPNGGTVMR